MDKARPQKILVGVDGYLHLRHDLIRLLSQELGEDQSDWLDYMLQNPEGWRTDDRIHQVLQNQGFTIQDGLGMEIHCKILEIPPDVQWYVAVDAYGLGEYVAEKHRIWK